MAGRGASGLREVVRAVAARLEEGGVPLALDAPLGALTTYRVGGPAALLVDASREADLLAVHDAMARSGAAGLLPLLVLGKGSNLVVGDSGFEGAVVRLRGELEAVEVRAGEVEPSVRAGGGAGLPVVARRSVDEGLAGLEWAVGIPGSVGGALKMNAGGHGSDTAACLRSARWVDLAAGSVEEAGPDRLAFGYRTSALGDADVVVWAELAAHRGDVATGRRAIEEIVRWRRIHQPGGKNAGSVFVNPPGDSAGRLVEAAGLKGFRIGTARVSEKHANFIQSDGTGSADDVGRLIAHVRRVVAERMGVLLRPEVKLVGLDGVADDGVADDGVPDDGVPIEDGEVQRP